ncbi:MAG: M48 family metalloprotease [Bacteroidetes bacterium]|nr:M48 family metalloprotease [Bacteroidota bacterium]
MFKNQIKTALLLGGLAGILILIGGLIGGRTGLLIGLVFAGGFNFLSYWFSHKIVLAIYRAKEADKSEYSKLYSMVDEIRHSAGIPMPKVYIVNSPQANAFATGRNPKHAVVAVTTGILNILNDNELKGVLAHEIGHIKNRDILISSVAATIAGVISYIAMMARWAAIFGGFGGRDRNGGGIVEFYDKEILNVYKQNSCLQGATGNSQAYMVTGLAFDASENLWASNQQAPRPLFVQKPTGECYSFKPTMNLGTNFIAEILVDESQQIWTRVWKGSPQGILVFNHNNTLDDESDDQWLLLRKGQGNGDLPSDEVNCITMDLDGDIWVGTEEGVAVFYCASQLFGINGCDADQILVDQGGYFGNLLESESVRAIAIDGANRKWIGTTNGVWLMSEDGTEEILRFTEDNSPLFSNNIISIIVDEKSGEVYFGTDKGIISYKSTATEGGADCEDLFVYPNPIREDYDGLIAIRGLVQDAKIKITDISGTLIYQTTALGGQTVWDGKNYNGERAKTGVYLVFASNADGSKTCVTKLLVIN